MAETALYLDHAATAPLLPSARAAMIDGEGIWANPSSPHRAGRAARAALEDARLRIAAALGWSGEVIFTSGASEAIEIAIRQSATPPCAVLATEHDAVLRRVAGVRRLPVGPEGLVSLDETPLMGLVAIQQVNSETGVIQPLAQIVPAVHGAGGVLLADCSQSAGKIALPPADLIAIAAHKFGGPVGIGALLVRDWSLLRPSGGQERGYRPGTENLPGALGMAAALEAGNEWLGEAARLRAMLDAGIAGAGGEVIARAAPRIAAIGSYRMPGVAATVQLIRFDAMGIAVSAGSACSSGSLKPSHVLTAMAMEEHAAGQVIRVSIGRETREADIARFLGAWRDVAGQSAPRSSAA